MIRYRAVVTIGAGSLKKVLENPVQGQRYIAQVMQMKRLSDHCEDIYFYFLIGGRTNGSLDGLDFIPFTDNSCICVEKVPTINWLRTSKFAYHNTNTISRFSQECGLYPVHAWISLLNVSCWDPAYAISSATRLIPVYWFYCSQEAHPKGIARPVLFEDRERGDKQLESIVSAKLGSVTPVFLGPHQVSAFKQRLRKATNPSTVTKFTEGAVIQPLTVDVESFPSPIPWDDREFDVGYFGRPDAEKGIDFVTSVLRSAKIDGAFDKGLVTFHRGSYESDFLDVRQGLDQEAYMESARGTKVLFYASKGEGFCFTVLECAMLGVIPVLPRLPWVTDNLFASDGLSDYPYIYDPWDELDARRCLDSALAGGDKWVCRLKDEMSKAFGSPGLNRVLVDKIKDDVAQSSKILSDVPSALSSLRCVDRAKLILSELGDEFRFSDFYVSAKKGAIAKGYMGRPMVDVGEWYVILQSLGYVDAGGHDPLMRKE